MSQGLQVQSRVAASSKLSNCAVQLRTAPMPHQTLWSIPRFPAAAAVVSSLSALQSAAASGSAADAKRGFVATVSALKGWTAAANVAADLKGL